jgi:hypothetical protein
MNITQYQIKCKDENVELIYNGYSVDYKQRVINHKSRCYNINLKMYNTKLYQTIRENGGIDNFEFIILEEHLVEDIQQARERERYWFDILHSNMNVITPNRSKKEYQQTDKWKEYLKEYQKTEKYKNYRKKYEVEYKNRKEVNEASKEYNKNYYETNKQIKINCECGSIIYKGNYNHIKTKKHQNYLLSIN